MPRIMDPTFVVSTSNGSGLLDLEQVPAEVKQEVEDIYAGLKANPAGRIRVAFDTVDELNAYTLQVQSYCANRPAGAIRFRKSPTRGLPDTYMDFRITDLKEAPPVTVNAPTTPVVPPVTVPPKAVTGRRK